MSAEPNRLRDSGLPLCFPAGPLARGGMSAPPPVLDTAVRMVARSLSVMQKEAFVLSSRTGRVWRLASDEGAYLDGHDHAPPPLAFLSVGLTASWMIELRALAARRGLDLRPRVGVDVFYSMSGSTTQGTMTGRVEDIALTLDPDLPLPRADAQGLAAQAMAASAAHGLLMQTLENRFALTHNDTRLRGLAVPDLDPAPLPPDRIDLDAMRPAPGDWSGVLRHTGRLAPRAADTTDLGAGWLTDGKARLIRLHSVAWFDESGLCVIDACLANPQGSVFRFLADDRSRAPDPETWLAAGIGFCFMTQFGRYAKSLHRPLRDTRLVQDLHLSLPGATGGTGLPGRAAPLDTHVLLTSDQDDAFARAAMAAAERSCYLHALCRQVVKPRLRLGPVA